MSNKPATRSPEESSTPKPGSLVGFHAIDDAESFFQYRTGGYHPVAIGDRLAGRYRILNKLGHGSYSTVWLARDEALQRLVAVKVCRADASPRESEILSHLGSLPDDGAVGRAMIPTILNKFRIDGPHGSHICLVTEPARCSISMAKANSHYAPFMLPVGRAIAVQLIFAVAYLHDNGFVHGDLHLGNILPRLPQEFQLWSDKELLENCGEPELVPVQRFDNEPIPPGVPHMATLPIWFPTPRITELSLSDAHIILADFGEAYRPLEETRLICCTPAYCCPPESRFEPTKPKSFTSDIWTLACAVWGILGNRSLFEMFFSTDDTAAYMQVQTLGKLPDEWWKKWDKRSEDFTEDGKLIRDDETFYSFDCQFERTIQYGRRKRKIETMDLAEKEALLAMVRPMLAYRPEQRCSIKDVLDSEWMTKYGMPDYEEMRA